MLYGRQQFVEEFTYDGGALTNNGRSLRIPDVEGFEKGLLVSGYLPEKMNYYLFPYKGKIRFIFVSPELVEWKAICNPFFRDEGNILECVGALYDLKTKRFMRFERKRTYSVFFNFILYDIGVPHVILDSKSRFLIWGLDRHSSTRAKYFYAQQDQDPVFISHVERDEETLEVVLTRQIFLEDQYGVEIAISFDNELNVIEILEDVVYDKTICRGSIYTSDMQYYQLVFEKDPTKKNHVDCGKVKSYHITGNDIVLLKDYNGENQIVVFEKGHVKIFKPSFFDWRMDSYEYMEIHYAKNDFENGALMFHMDTHQFQSVK